MTLKFNTGQGFTKEDKGEIVKKLMAAIKKFGESGEFLLAGLVKQKLNRTFLNKNAWRFVNESRKGFITYRTETAQFKFQNNLLAITKILFKLRVKIA